MRFTLFLSCALALTTFSASVSGQASPKYTSMFVFGDSLSDPGNLFKLIGQPPPPYWNGRFSNGPVWAEQIVGPLGIDPANVTNVAVGGSTTTDILTLQVCPVVTAAQGQLPSGGLYVYWGGANDLLDLLSNPSGNPQLVIGTAMAQTAAAVQKLVLAGAKNILVLNLPDLSKTPRVIALNDPIVSAGARALAQAYNQALAFTLHQLEVAFQLDIIEMDVFAMTEDITSNPRKYLFWSVDTPILNPNGTTRRFPNRYLFFDDIHPSFAGHRVIMRTGLKALGCPIPGDVNSDGLVNFRDLWALRRALRHQNNSAADLNHDGRVDRRDQKILFRLIL